MNRKTGTEIGICLFLNVFLMLMLSADAAYPQNADEIRNMIQVFKEDERGPFEGIRWFCKDGSILPARQPCEGEDGIQHGLHRAWVKNLAKEKGIYLGQILAGTEFADFWDSRNQNARLQQFIVEKFLQSADDGWIFRKARYYRGAVQMEDEEQWGQKFLEWLLADIKRVESQFFLLREAVREIPHGASENLWEAIRADSRIIAESYRAFENLRVKLHGRPEVSDIEMVRNFHAEHRDRMSSYAEQKTRKLIQDLEKAFAPADLRSLGSYIKRFSTESPVRTQLEEFIAVYGNATEKISHAAIKDQCRRISRMLVESRIRMLLRQSGRGRLSYADLSADLEKILFRQMNAWQPFTVRDLLEKSYVLAEAAAGCGLLELWEWDMVRPMLTLPENTDRLIFGNLTEKALYSRMVTEWGSGMIRAVYEPGVKIFSGFEPLTAGFMDDRIRSTVLLSLGDTAGQLAALAKEISGTENRVMGKSFPGMRGLNPGFAKGELAVAEDHMENISFSGEKIYVLPFIPSDIRPVAGIASVSEGNLVSHVQLLARNLGIPNAILSPKEAKSLLAYSGKTVFYAVSPRGTVIMKPESDMNEEEQNLTDKGTLKEDRILIPTDKISLSRMDLPGLKQVRASDSGKICGPKAANLGELRHLFPDNVVEGLVIPFGVFRQHMDLPMPGTIGTYWDFLGQVFDRAEAERLSGISEKEIETGVLRDLEKFRAALKGLTFLPSFRQQLTIAFEREFGIKMGNIPVFIRSDTNMEDLKEFTGAGLNLTVFNVRDAGAVWQGIRDVWASPFTERGYLWRQKYMRNPENVYPSILIMPTVTVEKSGVMITTDVAGSDSQAITLAFSAGPGGAVEGQAAESWLLKSDGRDQFLSPSREARYYVLPEKGGSYKGYRHFDRPLLNPEERMALRDFARQVKTVMAGRPGMESGGPWDVELGFKEGKIWLFQIRPFVENRHAQASAYLRNLDPATDNDREIPID
ncbi:MAG: PEP/pyruvate-binding domain-containing protein [Desulfococcaceae bacterium]